MTKLQSPSYLSGFGNSFATEAVPGALPRGRNSPQKVPFGLYAEQFSGTAFTAPRASNQRSWLYRIQPSARQRPYEPFPSGSLQSGPFQEVAAPPDPMRWDPLPMPSQPTDFLAGLVTYGGNGDPASQIGAAIHLYAANTSMTDRFLQNADGDLLLVPQVGTLRIRTELGLLVVVPGEICVLPRGIKFAVELLEDRARGYVCESYGASFRLPELGPIGANGLANARDFLYPAAAFEDRPGYFQTILKFQGNLWSRHSDHSPLDVVAWHGNLAPFKYDLGLFNSINTVSYDHPDPSIFTVLTSPSGWPGTANVDFVIFPPRWLVAEETFRPPWFHRNVMSEFMGLVKGVYDAKPTGFAPGGATLHNSMCGHGPDAESHARATGARLEPQFLGDTMAIMFETRLVIHPTRFALETPLRQRDYAQCWDGLRRDFESGTKSLPSTL